MIKTVEGGGKYLHVPRKKKKRVIQKSENRGLDFSVIQMPEDNGLKSIMGKIL